MKGRTPIPWYVERHDEDDGSINYEIWSIFKNSDGGTDMHRVVTLNDEDNENAKADAELIVKAINALGGDA